MNKEINLIRVSYGSKRTPKEGREYRIDGKGPVGTLTEYETLFPGHNFHIIDYMEAR